MCGSVCAHCGGGNWFIWGETGLSVEPTTGFGQFSADCWADFLAAAGHLGHAPHHAAITPLSPAFLSNGDVNNLISP